RIADQKVFRFVHKPASAQRLKLFIEAAMLSGDRQIASAAQTQDARGATATPPGGSSSLLPILGGLAAVLLLAIGGWTMMRKETTSAAPTSSRAAVTPDAPELTALLERAQRAFEAGSLVAANGSSAAELYR